MNKPFFLLIICCCFIHSNLFAQEAEIDSLLQQLELADYEEKAKLYNQLAELFAYEDVQKSIEFASQAYTISTEFGNKQEKYTALRNIGSGYRIQGNFQNAIEYHMQAFNILEETSNLEMFASIYIDLGIDYAELGNYEKSTEFFLLSLSTYENMLAEEDDIKTLNNYAICLDNVGINYDLLGLHDKALEYYQKSMEIAREIDDQELLADVLNNIGLIYEMKGEYQKALDYLKQALAIHETLGYERTIAIATANIALIYSSLEDYEQSLVYHQRTLDVFKLIEDKSSEALALANIASTYLDMNNPQMAYPYIQAAIDMATEINSKATLKIAYASLSVYYSLTNNYKEAYEAQKKLMELKDSLYKNELTESIAEMQTRYETEKKEQEIQLLTKDNEIQNLKIKKQSNQLYFLLSLFLLVLLLSYLIFRGYKLKQKQYQSDLEKKNLETEQRLLRTQMNPHFIFNSMNSIQSFISGNDNLTAMSYLSKFARLMRFILENSRKSFISLEDEIETLQLYIELERIRFKDKFEFSLNVDSNLMPETTYVPPMLVQPMVENAIKHGLRNKDGLGLLELGFAQQNGVIFCTVKDNGIGREKAGELKVGQQNDHRSLGMQVTLERMESLKQKMNVPAGIEIVDLKDNSGKAMGTLVNITIPYEKE